MSRQHAKDWNSVVLLILQDCQEDLLLLINRSNVYFHNLENKCFYQSNVLLMIAVTAEERVTVFILWEWQKFNKYLGENTSRVLT